MKVKQAKLAQALRGENSNLIDENRYVLEFDKGMLHAKLKNNPKNIGPFIVFPANIAFMEVYEEQEDSKKPSGISIVKDTAPASQDADKELPKTSKSKK